MELDVETLIYLPQDNGKCWNVVKSAKEIFLFMQQVCKFKKANENIISI